MRLPLAQRRTSLVLAVAVVVVLVVATLAVLLWRDHRRTDLDRAVGLAPPDAERLSWTDWAGVRSRLGARLSARSPTARLTSFLDRGYDADLTSASALLESAEVLHERYGFSPATADWELYSQSGQGAVDLVHLPDGTDFDAIGRRLERLGYSRPDDDTGVWNGGADTVARAGADLTPELQYLVLDAGDNLVLASDTAGYARQAMDDVDGGDGAPEELRAVAAASGSPLSAAVYDGDYTCSHLAMSGADGADQAQAAQLIRAAGEVNPVTGFAMSDQPGGRVRVVLSFENDDQARVNARSRARLAAGPAPGQGGDFADRFQVASVTARGTEVTLELIPREGASILSDLSTGPVLFATC